MADHHQQQQENFSQFTSLQQTPVMSEASSGNVLDKTEKMTLINETTLTRKKTTLYQTPTFYGSRQEKNQRTPSRACLPSSHPLQKLKVGLVWSCLLS